MKSAFMSDVFHAISVGEEFVMPVSPDATAWLTSVGCAVRNLTHALQVDLDNSPASRAATLPALRVRMGDLVGEIALQVGESVELVSYLPDSALEAAFGTLPELVTPVADSLGFSNDGDLSALVSRALEEMT